MHRARFVCSVVMLLAGCGDSDVPYTPSGVVDGGATAPMGKLCHDLAQTSGQPITVVLEIVSTSISASTLSCGVCQALPVGNELPFRVYWPVLPSEPLVEGTVDIGPDDDWLFVVTKENHLFKMSAGPLKDQYACETVDPFGSE